MSTLRNREKSSLFRLTLSKLKIIRISETLGLDTALSGNMSTRMAAFKAMTFRFTLRRLRIIDACETRQLAQAIIKYIKYIDNLK